VAQVKPAGFEYHRPDTLDGVLAILHREGEEAKVLAGGQSLVPLMNMRIVRPAHLVDINRVEGLDRLESGTGPLRIGALVRWSDVLRSDAVRSGWPLLAEAVRHVGHLAIRNRGTVCGGAAHADPAAELPAVLVALEARLLLASASGRREVAAADFFLGLFTTALDPSELLTEIVIPRPPPGAHHGFAEFARRPGDFALAGAAYSGSRLVAFGAGARPAVLPLPDGGDDGELRAAVAGLEIAGDIHADVDWRRAAVIEMARRAYRAAA
jgi:aerobic carbon-monoxide dehydrogenase medium subunit